MNAARKVCGTAGITSGTGRRWRRGAVRNVADRLVEDARTFLLIIQRQRTSYDDALDGLVRDAFGSADRLRAAATAARACGRPTAEADLLERAADLATRRTPPRWSGSSATRSGTSTARSSSWTATSR